MTERRSDITKFFEQHKRYRKTEKYIIQMLGEAHDRFLDPVKYSTDVLERRDEQREEILEVLKELLLPNYK
jgi:hypothetical protein